MKQFIGKLRAWKKAYDVFPSMAADREFQEMLDGFTPSNDEGGLIWAKNRADELGHHIAKNNDGGAYSKGMYTAYWAIRDEIQEYIDSHPTPTSQEPFVSFSDRKKLAWSFGEWADENNASHTTENVLTWGLSIGIIDKSAARLWLEKLADKEEGK